MNDDEFLEEMEHLKYHASAAMDVVKTTSVATVLSLHYKHRLDNQS